MGHEVFAMHIGYHFQGALVQLLRSRWRKTEPIIQPFSRAASIKDAIEAFGPPHTEIGSILCDGRQVDFNWPLSPGQVYTIAPVPVPWNICQGTLLRPEPLSALRFLADGTVGRLARYLRMAGYDTVYDPDWTGEEIVALLQREPRILLTKNTDLLKRKTIVFGRLIRAERPVSQLGEVLDLFGHHQINQPLSRCLLCNRPLEPVAKAAVLHRLEPLTIRYHDTFHRCRSCDRIYWVGSHVARMRVLLGLKPEPWPDDAPR